MKKILSILLVFLLLFTLTMGCEKEKEYTDSIKIVCTIFPVYDWVKSITSEIDPDRAENLFGSLYGGRTTEVDLVFLYDNGTDLHSYQATAGDMVDIATCDLLIYVGGESDKWIADAIESTPNPNRRVICLMDEIKESLISTQHHHEGEEHTVYDEHVWLSLKNAAFFCERISDVIKEIDPENQVLYALNEEEYVAKLNALDRYIEDLVNTASKKALVFADRFPFAYLMRDYGIEYYAAFEGCSSETDASFDTIISLASKVDELGIEVLLTTEKTDGNVADAVILASSAKDLKIRPLNSMQSISYRDAEQGDTYLAIMEDNIVFLKEALN